MATNTYVALAKVTASGSSTTQLIMTSIPNTYTDLIIVGNIPTSMVGVNGYLQFNGDTGSNYSWTRLFGDGSSASSSRGTSQTGINYLVNDYTTTICQIQNYSNSTTYKTALVRANNPSDYVTATVGLWRNTAAITSVTIDLDGNTIPSGTTFSLYGIKAQVTPGTAKATGGTITYDQSGYVYHTFTSTGTFTPSQALTCDYLVVAGGGGGGSSGTQGGGGGAGGLRSTVGLTGGGSLPESRISVAATAYTITVGAGGGADTNGVDSTFSTVTSVGGGKGGHYSSTTGGNGGSGGGAGAGASGGTGGTGTANQGFAGGTSPGVNGNHRSGGGGGAGAVGVNAGTNAGAGGAGISIPELAAPTSTGSSLTYAGGGGGAAQSDTATYGVGGTGGGGRGGFSNSGGSVQQDGVNGTANTGSGGGGRAATGVGSGASGIVIIRYSGV
jgi:hypothetical protein